MIYRQARKSRVWYDTEFSRSWQLTGLLAAMWGALFAPVPHPLPDNDRDHILW